MRDDELFLIVDAVKEGLIETAKSVFPETGVVPTPQIYCFDSASAKGLIGYAVCRDYTRGPDAGVAIGSLGILADAMDADLVVLMWEEADLRTSLYGPSDDHPTGIVILEATLDEHELSWYPFTFTVIGYDADGLPRLNVRFGETSHTLGAALPSVIEQLLGEWRSHQVDSAEEAQAMVRGAQADGYQVAFTT